MSTTPPTPLTNAELFRIAKALADPQRVELLEKLAAANEQCCSDFVACFQVSQATISHHLKELATAGLVERRKEGQFAYFTLVPGTLQAYMAELARRLKLEQPYVS